jgi:predicted DCC family thiol-disulfide oxidoreductase YuxK
MAGHRPAALLYDAECGFCRVTAGLVLGWDRGRRLTPVALQDPSAPQWLSGLSEAERMASWHLVEPDGVRHSAGAALAPLFEILPRATPLARLVRRSPAGAERVYGFAAEHRDLLAKLVPSRLRRRAEEIIERRFGTAPEAGDSAPEAIEPSSGQPVRAADGDGMSFGEQPHPPVGSTSTSDPHPSQDPEAEQWEGPKRDRLDQ